MIHLLERGGLRRLLLAATVCLALAPAPGRTADLPPDLADRLAPVLPGIVNIEAVTALAKGRHYYAWGSGFIVEPSGIIVTNRHVIAGAGRITVSGRAFAPQRAKLLYVSSLLDLALLKIDAGKPLTALAFGDSDRVRIGDPVLAIGNPLGIGESVSAGIVSALDRNIRETSYDDFIQTDAAINHGNSGGPMVDLDGKVVGIDTALYSSPHNTGSIGLGFAMPANDAKFIVDQVIHFGKVTAGWAGLHLQGMTAQLADGFGLPQPRGVLVAGIDDRAVAATGMVRPGDVIVAVAGNPVTNRRDVQRAIVEAPVGSTLALTLLRGGVEQAVAMPIAADPNDTAEAQHQSMQPLDLRVAAATPSDTGMRLAPLTPANRTRYDIAPRLSGVLVTEAMPHSAAEERGILAGELILRVREDVVHAPAEVVRDIGVIADKGIEYAPLLVYGRKGTRWIALPVASTK